MKRIDERTVELTDREHDAEEYFEDLLDEGYGIHDAANVTKMHGGFADLSDDFYEWLTD